MMDMDIEKYVLAKSTMLSNKNWAEPLINKVCKYRNKEIHPAAVTVLSTILFEAIANIAETAEKFCRHRGGALIGKRDLLNRLYRSCVNDIQSKDTDTEEEDPKNNELGHMKYEAKILAIRGLQIDPAQNISAFRDDNKSVEYADLPVKKESRTLFLYITETCLHVQANIRKKGLKSLETDPSIYEIYPHLSRYISKKVKSNIIGQNFFNLMCLMEMTSAFVKNETINVPKILHLIVPGVVSCIVTKQFSNIKPPNSNQILLREYSAKLMKNICDKFSTNIYRLHIRTTEVFKDAITNEHPLSTVCGGLIGLRELDKTLLMLCITSSLGMLCERIKKCDEDDCNSAQYIKSLLESQLGKEFQKICNDLEKRAVYKMKFLRAKKAQFKHEMVHKAWQKFLRKKLHNKNLKLNNLLTNT